MIPRSDDRLAEVRLIADAVADVLVERGLVVAEHRSAGRVMSAAQVAATLGLGVRARRRAWRVRYGPGSEGAARVRGRRGGALVARACDESREPVSGPPRARGSRVEGIDLIPYERPHTEP
jgi:hypothetical protein